MPIDPPPLLTVSAYARRRRCSPAAVLKAIATQRIACIVDARGRKWIDPRTANREWAANTDPSKVRNG